MYRYDTFPDVFIRYDGTETQVCIERGGNRGLSIVELEETIKVMQKALQSRKAFMRKCMRKR